jgi:murein DD-endopeptidase MepM/ murein hydrolase activator NlpD
MELAKNLGEAYITNQMVEGNAKTRSLGLAGVDPAKQANFDAGINVLKQESAEATNVALDMHKNGAPPEALEYIKSLPSYQRVAGMRNYIANRKKGYQTYLTEFLTSKTIQLPRPGGGSFTPDEIDDDPVLTGIALDAAARMYDLETGVDQFSKEALTDYNNGITDVNTAFSAKVQQRGLVRKSDQRVNTAVESFKNDLDINALVSEIAGTLGPKGIRSYGDALDMVYQEILPSLRRSNEITSQQFRSAIEQPAANDPKGSPHSKFYRNRIFGAKGTWDKINNIDSAEYTEKQNERKRIIEDDRNDLFKQVEQLAEQGVVISDDVLDQRLKALMESTGIYDPSAFLYYQDVKTREKLDVEQAKEKLDYLRSVNGRGYLVAEDLEGMPQSVVTAYGQAVRDDAEYAKFAPSYDTRAKARVSSLTDEIWKENVGRDEKNTRWNKSYDAMYADYLLERQKNLSILGVENHADANERALRTVESRAKDGSYDTPAGPKDHSERVEQITNYRRKLSKGEKIFQQPDLWSDATKKNLEDFNAGRAQSYDPIFDTLALNIPGKTGWDLANELHRSIHGSDLKKTVKQEAIEAQGPAVQRFIRGTGATPNRIRRGQVMDDPQGSFNPRPAKPIVEYAPQVSSIVMESAGGQPGMDIYFEDKQFPAVLGGVVKDIRYQVNPDGSGYGHLAVVESRDPQTGETVDVLYSHFDTKPNLKVGQRVAAGQVLGRQGGSGSVRSVDGTIASIDFLAPAPRGSNSMTPYRGFKNLRMYIQNQLQGGR